MEAAVATRVEGWDWRCSAAGSPTTAVVGFPAVVRSNARAATAPLDLGTGGGEFLSGLAPLPPRTAATEAYPPNAPVARDRLAPLGIEVVDTAGTRPMSCPSLRLADPDPATRFLSYLGSTVSMR